MHRTQNHFSSHILEQTRFAEPKNTKELCGDCCSNMFYGLDERRKSDSNTNTNQYFWLLSSNKNATKNKKKTEMNRNEQHV